VADYDRVLSVSLRGNYFALRSVLKHYLDNEIRGSVLMTASINGLGGTPGMDFYDAAKHSVIGLMKSAAREYGPKGIRINAVLPGITETKALQGCIDSLDGGAKLRAEMESSIPLVRLGKPSELPAAVAWLLSDEASYVTGNSLIVDGGLAAGSTVTNPTPRSDPDMREVGSAEAVFARKRWATRRPDTLLKEGS